MEDDGERRLKEEDWWKRIGWRRLVEDDVWTIVGQRRLEEDYELRRLKTIYDDCWKTMNGRRLKTIGGRRLTKTMGVEDDLKDD